MNYFIFQSLKDRFDLQQRLRVDQVRPWIATRYRTLMAQGDLVFYWQGGEPSVRGIYGWGRISSDPALPPGDDTFHVDVTCFVVLPHHVAIEDIKANPLLRGMQVLNLPVGTNFRINAAEAAALAGMMPSDLRPPQQPATIAA